MSRTLSSLEKYLVTALTLLVGVLAMLVITSVFKEKYAAKTIRAGFVYIGDQGTAYTSNFCRAQTELENMFGNKVVTVAKYNISEEGAEAAIRELAMLPCDIIFSTSYGYSTAAKKVAAEFPHIQFCQATGVNAHEEPFVANYHNFMGTIYEGRYVTGVVAGMKIQELMAAGKLPAERAHIGYVAAFPYPEVISGYTAFFLGVRSIVPDALMTVRYTDTWSSYASEKKCAEELIFKDKCVIISQHSDTTGPAVACEEASSKKGACVFHVGYNQRMTDVAPTTSLVASRINWAPYVTGAVSAVMKGKRIESVVRTGMKGNDAGAGFSQNWVEILGMNYLIVAPGTEETVVRIIKQFGRGSGSVFKGNYLGVNPFDENDRWDLRKTFPENAAQSAPLFRYVLKDVIEIK